MGLHVPLRVFRSSARAVSIPDAPSRDQRRIYVRTPPGDARALSLAFMRYLELHGRSVTKPADGCRLRRSGAPNGQTLVLDFWSRKAAEEFDYFWRRYRPTFGELDAAEAAAGRAVA